MNKINQMIAFILLSVVYAVSAQATSVNEAINETLDNFHQAAAQADYQTYFNLLADDGIFLGTDASERWNKEQFAKYVKPYFSKGQGWRYVSTERHISPVEGSNLVFFDELLDNKNYGQCRGSGVLIFEDNQWRILQYNLSVMVPNGVARKVVSMIQQSQTEQK